MNRLRLAIVVLTVLTAVIHLGIGATTMGERLGQLLLLNGIGYLVLLAAFWLDIPKGQGRTVAWVLIAYAAVTIVAYFVSWGASGFTQPVGMLTKLIEVLLIVAVYLHLRRG
ncbi:MAG: hypothetical protein N2383_08540 [Caldilineales bacterium]|nr:hypothetical protein [Caldilineales bacterium]